MKPETIAKRIVAKRHAIEAVIDKYSALLTKLQDTCIHFNLRYRYDGSSGGYDYDGSYWVDWYCPDCQKRWRTDQEYKTRSDLLKKYPTAKEISKWHSPKEYENFYHD